MKESLEILIVDDNEDLLSTFALILKRKGALVNTARDGLEALDKFSQHHFDIVLMDAMMPRMDGIEALHKMRAINPRAKIVLITAYYEEQQLQSVLNEGACGALFKPVNIAQLMKLIGDLTDDSPVLIVDDDDDFRENTAKILTLQGYKVNTSASGEQAIRMVKQKDFKIIFVDYKMPHMDGLATALRLKEIDPSLLIVMMTGYREEVKAIIHNTAGNEAMKCLYKPFHVEELSQLVAKAI